MKKMDFIFFLILRTTDEAKTFCLRNTVSGLLRVNISKELEPYLTTTVGKYDQTRFLSDQCCGSGSGSGSGSGRIRNFLQDPDPDPE
jgi:hypothetical protein